MSGGALGGRTDARRSALRGPPAGGWSLGGAQFQWGIWLFAGYYVLLLLDNLLLRGPTQLSSYIDEIFCLTLGGFALAGLRHLTRTGWCLVGLFLAYLILSMLSAAFSDLENYPRVLATAVGVVLDAKLLIAMMALVYLLRKHPAARLYGPLLLVIIAVAAVNSIFVIRDLLAGGSDIFGATLDTRLGFPQAHGLFHHQTASVDISMLGSFAAASLFVSRGRPVMAAVWIYLTLIALLHFLAKEIVTVTGCSLMFMLSIGIRDQFTRIVARLGALFVAAIVSLPYLTYLAPFVTFRFQSYFGHGADEGVRVLMYVTAFDIARDYFPLGSGAGTFGSYPSRSLFYSPIYDHYGLSNLYGASRFFSDYLMDTFWPKVLGESGFFGAVAYLGFLGLLIWRAFQNLLDRTDSMTLFSAAVLIALTIQSLAASVFTHELYAPLIGVIGAFTLIRNSEIAPKRAGRPARPVAGPGARHRGRQASAPSRQG